MLKIFVFLAILAGAYGGGVVDPALYHPDAYYPAPLPYDFGFQTADELGTQLSRQESGDGSGGVTGSYGYFDANGVYRLVKYIADVEGFRAQIETSEPGTDNKNPAGVTIISNPVPAPVVIKHPVVKQGYPAHPIGAIKAAPEPYNFGFQTADEFGTQLSRQESGDGSGAVSGSYGYADANGIWRQVRYVADGAGFRAEVDTNEPGTDNQNPADVTVSANPAPVVYKHAPVIKHVAPIYAPYAHPVVVLFASLVAMVTAGYVGSPGYGGYGHDYYYPQPYNFGYNVVDYYGNQQWRAEQSDAGNRKTGSYGYRDAYGLWREVNYVADEYGFRANVKSNEPGTANQNPADVSVYSNAGYYPGGVYQH
ncbi:uncharacterized protein LOC106458484 [Limulus polyphemus]|uniref:Uncharacterized protein LOC106458484 n=1 Tax=Limulus polyphemus TaxID=6850 RepID=A0ABM1B2H4_LIMPO|nr:uncharacterized protein LOC106458484 [Limulus polyphemus]